MALLDPLLSTDSLGLGVAALAAACLSYALVSAARRTAAALAGVAAGLVTGTLVGAGVPAVAGAVVGGVGGFLAADRRPGGATVAVAGGAGLSVGLLATVAVTGNLALAATLPLGAACGVGLAALGWRFPRAVVVPAMSAVVGIVALVGRTFAPRSVDALAAGVLVGPPPLAADQVPYLLIGPVAFLLVGVAVQAVAVEYGERLAPLLPAGLRGRRGDTDGPDDARHPCPECGASRESRQHRCRACGAGPETEADDATDRGGESPALGDLARLGAAVMLADGRPSRAEAERLTDVLTERFADRDADEVQNAIKRAGKSEPDLDAVLTDLSGTLDSDGGRAALSVAVEVAEADGEVTADEAAAVASVEAAFDLGSPESGAGQRSVNPTA